MSLMLNVRASVEKSLCGKVITWDENSIHDEIKVKCHVCHISWSLKKFKLILVLPDANGMRTYKMFLRKFGRISTKIRSKLQQRQHDLNLKHD